MRRRYSPKRAALVRAFGKSWREVALEWDAREDLTQDEIADRWTREVQAINPAVSFSKQDVHRYTKAAKKLREAAQAVAP